jgi:PAS fold
MAMKLWRTEEVGLFDINFDTGEQYWSYELRHILGVERDVPAEFHLLLQCVHPEDRRAFYETAMQPFRPDCPARTISEFRIVRPDSGAQWVHAERVSIFRPGTAHDVVRIVGFVVEISRPTQQRRAWQLIDITA